MALEETKKKNKKEPLKFSLTLMERATIYHAVLQKTGSISEAITAHNIRQKIADTQEEVERYNIVTRMKDDGFSALDEDARKDEKEFEFEPKEWQLLKDCYEWLNMKEVFPEGARFVKLFMKLKDDLGVEYKE